MQTDHGHHWNSWNIETAWKPSDDWSTASGKAAQLHAAARFRRKSYRDIANILGITEEQVKVNIFRARQTIKQKYQETENYGL